MSISLENPSSYNDSTFIIDFILTFMISSMIRSFDHKRVTPLDPMTKKMVKKLCEHECRAVCNLLIDQNEPNPIK